MEITSINTESLSRMFLAGAKNLEAKKEWINELNVFPVPDGDTGTNMSMTIMSAAREVGALSNPTMKELAKARKMRGVSTLKKGDLIDAMLELDEQEEQKEAAEEAREEVKEEKKVSKEAKISVTIFLIAMVGIVLLGAVSGLVPTLADGSKLPLTTVIEIFMLVAAAAMILLTKLDSNKVLDQPVFRTGMFAVVLAFGLCWLVNTFIGDQSSFITDNMSALTNKYPWIFIVAVFIVGAITTSQSSTTMIMIPIGIALGLPANVIVAGWIACSSNYFIPASGQCVAALAFDSAGTTKIGKFVLNHSYMIPGLVCTVVSVVVALLIGAVVF